MIGVKTTRSLRRAGRTHALAFEEKMSLLDAVREAFGVASSSRGCTDGTCGTCRLLLNGRVVNACGLVWREIADGAEVETYEDVADEPAARRAIEAFTAERPTRCTLCVGSLGVAAVALAREGRQGALEAVDEMLAHATCMCTGRGSLRRALLRR